jgi:hypothetical protein
VERLLLRADSGPRQANQRSAPPFGSQPLTSSAALTASFNGAIEKLLKA